MRWLTYTAIIAAVIFAGSAAVASALGPPVTGIVSGGTATSTAPSYGKVLIGGKNGEYEFAASSTLNIISSVFSRTGAIVAQSGDYTTTLVTEGSNLYFTTARAITALTGLNISIFTND